MWQNMSLDSLWTMAIKAERTIIFILRYNNIAYYIDTHTTSSEADGFQ